MLLGIFFFFVLCYMIYLEGKKEERTGKKTKYKDETGKYVLFDHFIDKK